MYRQLCLVLVGRQLGWLRTMLTHVLPFSFIIKCPTSSWRDFLSFHLLKDFLPQSPTPLSHIITSSWSFFWTIPNSIQTSLGISLRSCFTQGPLLSPIQALASFLLGFNRQTPPVLFRQAVSNSPSPLLVNPLSSDFSFYHSIKLSLAKVTKKLVFGKSCSRFSFFILFHLAEPTKPTTLPYWWVGQNPPPVEGRGQGAPTMPMTLGFESHSNVLALKSQTTREQRYPHPDLHSFIAL